MSSITRDAVNAAVGSVVLGVLSMTGHRLQAGRRDMTGHTEFYITIAFIAVIILALCCRL